MRNDTKKTTSYSSHHKRWTLITGVTGLIGSHIAEYLLRKGHRIIVLIRSKGNNSASERFNSICDFLRINSLINSKIRVVEGSLDKFCLGLEKSIYKEMNNSFQTVIGLEIHVQLKTDSKMFCPCSTEFGKTQNSSICPVCTGQPGVLPVANKKAIELTLLTGIALDCDISDYSVFARKNYFYPDLPKNYQISQFELPICGKNGYVEIVVEKDNPKSANAKTELKEQITAFSFEFIHATGCLYPFDRLKNGYLRHPW